VAVVSALVINVCATCIQLVNIVRGGDLTAGALLEVT
jgi:hypothetical protein